MTAIVHDQRTDRSPCRRARSVENGPGGGRYARYSTGGAAATGLPVNRETSRGSLGVVNDLGVTKHQHRGIQAEGVRGVDIHEDRESVES